MRVLSGKYEKRLLAVLFLVMEATSVALDQFGKRKLVVLLAAFILSALGFAITLYTCIKEKASSEAERQLKVLEVLFSLIQLVASFVHFVLTVLQIKNDYNLSIFFPFAFTFTAAVFVFKSDGNNNFMPRELPFISKNDGKKNDSTPGDLLDDNGEILVDKSKQERISVRKRLKSPQSFWSDKGGKNCYMISARELEIEWGDKPRYWGWIHLPEAKFPEVAELKEVWWFDIRGKISTSILSPRTTYVFYLVFKPINKPCGFENNPVKVTIGLADSGGQTRTVYLDTTKRRFPGSQVSVSADDQGSFPEDRGDGWLESELGDYFYGDDEDRALSMMIQETDCDIRKSGLVFQGIEIRPKKE